MFLWAFDEREHQQQQQQQQQQIAKKEARGRRAFQRAILVGYSFPILWSVTGQVVRQNEIFRRFQW